MSLQCIPPNNNFNSDNQSIISDGSIVFTKNVTNVKDQVTIYMNGSYTVCASSFMMNNFPYLMFNNDNTSRFWIPNILNYVGIANPYKPGNKCSGPCISTIVSDGTKIVGEWVQIQLPYSFNLTTYQLTGELNKLTHFYIVGSDDGIDWTVVDKENVVNVPVETDGPIQLIGDPIPKKYTVSSNPNTYFSFYRIIFDQIDTDRIDMTSFPNIIRWQLFGNGTKLNPPFVMPKTVTSTATSSPATTSPIESFSNKSSIIEGIDGTDNAPQLFAEMNKFNAIYKTYIDCNSNKGNVTIQSNCTDKDRDVETVNAAYKRLITYTTATPTVTKMPSLQSDKYSLPIDASYEYIKDTYHNDILHLRSELDSKMLELNRASNSSAYDYEMTFNSTIYSGILWSVLASSLIYYVFTKL